MGRKNSSGQALPCMPACGAGTQPQTSSKLSTLFHIACMHPLPKLIWPPTKPADTPPLCYLHEEGRMQEGSVLG